MINMNDAKNCIKNENFHLNKFINNTKQEDKNKYNNNFNNEVMM